jgi:hypothetical protein
LHIKDLKQQQRLNVFWTLLAGIAMAVIVSILFYWRKAKKGEQALILAKDTGFKILAFVKDTQTIYPEVAIQKLIDVAYKEFYMLFRMDILKIGIFDETENKLIFPYALTGFDKTLPQKEFFLNSKADSEKLAVVCFKKYKIYNGEIYIKNYRNKKECMRKYGVNRVEPQNKEEDSASILYLPLLENDKPIGVISIQSLEKDAFKKYDRLLFRILSSYVAITLSNILKNKSLIEDFAISDTIASIIRHDISPMIQDEIPRALEGLQHAIQSQDESLSQQGASVISIFTKLKRIFSALTATSLLSVRKLPFNSSTFDLIKVFEASQVLENNLKPEVKLIFEKNEPCWVRADRILVEILLRNLIQNAINHTHKGSIRIYAFDYDDDFIQVSVSDTGEGIPDERKETIFNVGNNAKGKNGHGFGLVLCQHIIAKHKDCKIGVNSKIGEGSAFYFTLKKANINR